MNSTGIGNRIKQLREERDMSMDMLVSDMNRMYELNLTKGMISRWERSINEPSLEYAKYLVKYFNVSLDWMIGLTDKKTPPHLRKEK